VTVRLRDNEEEELVRGVFRSLFAQRSTPEHVRNAELIGHDPELWARLVAIGAPAMGIAEEAGGGGATASALAIVAEEAGRALAPVPLLEHQVAAGLLARADAPGFRDVVAGDVVATIALRPSRTGVWDVVSAGAVAEVVVGIHGVDAIVVRRPPDSGALPNGGSQPLANVTIADGNATTLGPAALLAPWMDAWRVLVAASLLGAAEAALQLGLSYVMERHQFGKPIGSFQAVQHGLADLPSLLEGTRLLVGKAAWALDRGEPGTADLYTNEITDGRVLASMAYLFATETAAHTVDRVLQYHGAIGCALESDAQLYYRRVRSWPLVLGPRRHERRHLASLLLDVA
jgi:alkylation response protein AidB-like acyl-CoA dehydrogenase